MTRPGRSPLAESSLGRDDTLREVALRYAGFGVIGLSIILGEFLVRLDELLFRSAVSGPPRSRS